MPLPTKAQWTTLKSNAGIAQSKWYKPADAAVGPALASVESAKAKWKAKKNLDNAMDYVGALAKLHAAFTKFVNKKDLANAGALGGQITGWMNEVATKHTNLVAKVPTLKTAKDDELVNILEKNF